MSCAGCSKWFEERSCRGFKGVMQGKFRVVLKRVAEAMQVHVVIALGSFGFRV